MQEKLSDNRALTSSRASSFFIDNILGNKENGQGSVSSSGGGISGVETVASGRVLNTHYADGSAPITDGPSYAARSPYRDSPVQWYRRRTDLNFRALDTAQSEYSATAKAENSYTKRA